ncbi:MAG: WecB/TagA/CpsF family glycosyltransferase [Bacteroidales bacterium]|nr:WecB/TagA/CpsF family glycosyltransferase [Bacteroidales bacterium]
MISLRTLKIVESMGALATIPAGKVLINTINAHSYNTARNDEAFAEALQKGDYLVPDGMSIVKACNLLKAVGRPEERIAGWDLFIFEMERLNERGGTCFFLGSSEAVLSRIKERCAVDYPAIVVESYSPPYKPEFSDEDNQAMIQAVNSADPDLLWIGMTAPKQEKWAFLHWKDLDVHCHCGTIGAVFDFYAGTVSRAPEWMQKAGLEWLYRLLKEPRRMWRRYIVGNMKFLWNIISEITHPNPAD